MSTLAGCIISNDENGGRSVKPLNNGYFPLTIGSTWYYKQTDNTSGYDYIININGASGLYSVATYEEDDGDVWDEYYRSDGNAVYLKYGDTYSKRTSILSNIKKRMSGLRTSEINELIMFYFDKNEGYSWIVEEDSYQDNGWSETYTSTATYLGSETVKISAGLFHDCMKFEHIKKYTYTEDNHTSIEEDVYTFWLAPGIGIVRIIEENFESYAVEELVGYKLDSSDGYDGGYLVYGHLGSNTTGRKTSVNQYDKDHYKILSQSESVPAENTIEIVHYKGDIKDFDISKRDRNDEDIIDGVIYPNEEFSINVREKEFLESSIIVFTLAEAGKFTLGLKYNDRRINKIICDGFFLAGAHACFVDLDDLF